jgi:hypothetical protein
MHIHFARVEQRARDLEGIVNLPAFGVHLWAKDRAAFSIGEHTERGRRIRHTARQENDARRQPKCIISVKLTHSVMEIGKQEKYIVQDSEGHRRIRLRTHAPVVHPQSAAAHGHVQLVIYVCGACAL